MICFKEAEDDKLARQLSWLGINKDTYARSNKGTYSWKYDVDHVGYKYGGNAIMAAIGLVQLKYLDEENARRREIVEKYNAAFAGNERIKVVGAPHSDECSYHIYELIVPDREKMLVDLQQQEIYCGVHYRDNIEYSMYRYAEGTCPVAREVSEHIITLPLHMWLTDEDVDIICEAVIKSVNSMK
ncbi:MAG: DegT/DnrJ/EryC1/StrS family aminotransferase, partial [Holdemanella sp.]|nr:DegT/DnrJ/EryC1/StrS family aminotransferase [Holdemanella sp.]